MEGMRVLLGDWREVDMNYYNNLVHCLKETDPVLYDSVNAQWTGFRNYAASGKFQS